MTFERSRCWEREAGNGLAAGRASPGRDVVLWSRDAKAAQANARLAHQPLLPDVAIDKRITVTSSLADALKTDAILAAVPGIAARACVIHCAVTARRHSGDLLRQGHRARHAEILTEIIAEAAPAPSRDLSGPSFADDVRADADAVTLAAADETVAADSPKALGSATFRPYHTSDLRGVEIGGAAKNVLAIATGSCRGAVLRQCRGGFGHTRLCRTRALWPQTTARGPKRSPACPALAILC